MDTVLVVGGAFALLLVASFFLLRKKSRKVLDPEVDNHFPLIDTKLITDASLPCPSYRFRFALPYADVGLGLPIGQHISLRIEGADGKVVARSYTPTSSNDDHGFFDLVVKVYPTGVMGNHLLKLNLGDSIAVRGPKGRFTYVKNKFTKIGMIAGGSGVTPMFQIAKEIVKHADDKTEVSLIFGNVTEQDILLREEIDEMAKNYPSKFKVYYVLDKPPQNWTGGSGFVTAELIQAKCPAPTDANTINLVCGPPPMVKSIKAHFEKLGYSQEQLFAF